MIDVLVKAITMPPTAAIAADSPNAYSLAPRTEMPSAAAARSLVRTATKRRPVRPRRTLLTTSVRITRQASAKSPYRVGCEAELMFSPKSVGELTWVPNIPPVRF